MEAPRASIYIALIGKEPQKEKVQFIVKSTLYVEPKFDVPSIPQASQLPMVCVPMDWGIKDNAKDMNDGVPSIDE